MNDMGIAFGLHSTGARARLLYNMYISNNNAHGMRQQYTTQAVMKSQIALAAFRSARGRCPRFDTCRIQCTACNNL